jgi:hypothetical protein
LHDANPVNTGWASSKSSVVQMGVAHLPALFVVIRDDFTQFLYHGLLGQAGARRFIMQAGMGASRNCGPARSVHQTHPDPGESCSPRVGGPSCGLGPAAKRKPVPSKRRVGCGAGHANLTNITVSPQSATTTSNPQGQVGYTDTGNFANGKNRELSQVDGLSWKTSPTSTGTTAATIGSTGEATCSAPGTVTVTASAPQNLQFTVNNGVQNTSATVSGTATLICQ